MSTPSHGRVLAGGGPACCSPLLRKMLQLSGCSENQNPFLMVDDDDYRDYCDYLETLDAPRVPASGIEDCWSDEDSPDEGGAGSVGESRRRVRPAALKKPAGTALKPSSFVSPLFRSFFMKIGGSSHSLVGSRKRKGRSRAERALKQASRAEEKKIIADLGNCLGPVASDFEVRLGIAKEVYPDMIATRCSGRVQVYEGHPFLVQAAVSLGASDSVKQGVNIFRFEKGNPFLFKPGADAATKIALKRIKWSAYKMNRFQDKICVFVCIIGAKIPSKGTGIKYIATAVESVIRQCCSELRSEITKMMLPKRERTPDMAYAYADALYDAIITASEVCPHKTEEAREMYSRALSGEVTRETLREKFRKRLIEWEKLDEVNGVSKEPTEDGLCPSDYDCPSDCGRNRCF